jgi:hypothetical protein
MRVNNSQPHEDALARFCEDLSVPLEKLANVVYLASLSASHSKDPKPYLARADELLAGIREMVLTHCRRKAA